MAKGLSPGWRPNRVSPRTATERIVRDPSYRDPYRSKRKPPWPF